MQLPVAGTFPLFRSGLALSLITELYVSDKEFSLSELAARLEASKPALSKQLPDLVSSGLLAHRTQAGASFYRAEKSSPFYDALLTIIELSEAPPAVVSQELAGVGGIEELLIFGSWSLRKSGVVGAAPNDIDLLVVGDPDEDDLAEACARASRRLHREVNPKITSASDWVNASSEFLRALRAGALHQVTHDPRPKRTDVEPTHEVSSWEAELLG